MLSRKPKVRISINNKTSSHIWNRNMDIDQSNGKKADCVLKHNLGHIYIKTYKNGNTHATERLDIYIKTIIPMQ